MGLCRSALGRDALQEGRKSIAGMARSYSVYVIERGSADPGRVTVTGQYSTRTRNVPSMAAIASRRLAVCSSSAVTSMTT